MKIDRGKFNFESMFQQERNHYTNIVTDLDLITEFDVLPNCEKFT